MIRLVVKKSQVDASENLKKIFLGKVKFLILVFFIAFCLFYVVLFGL